MITIEQMLIIKQRMKTIWKDIMADAGAVRAWADTFKEYEFADVEQAVIDYMKSDYFKPTPADILKKIPAAPVKENQQTGWQPNYERMPDGQQRRVIRCKRCRDTGLVTWIENDCYVGRPCTCPAAIANYGPAIRARYE